MGKHEFAWGSPLRNRFSEQMQRYRGHHPRCYEQHLKAEEYSRQQKGSVVRKAGQRCLEFANEYVHNELPTHLIRISDMKLITRNEVLDDVLPLILNSKELSEGQLWSLCGGDWITASIKVQDYYQDYARMILKFAIFSHRWGTHEPAFYEMSTTRYGEKPKPTGPGYTKLEEFCKQASEYGCAYAWSDTCCINKESSTELEEAIRSMYRWYESAYVCIVYLAGTGNDSDCIVTRGRYGYTSVRNSTYSGGFSEEDPWFKRGWTLQELLAPRRLRFFSKDWQPVCPSTTVESNLVPPFPYPNDKTNLSALETISYITKIPTDVLRDFSQARNSISVSDKMKWAMKRKTTRVEDTAYSLLGIFDIGMPIAYGEGARAFHRLMEALMESSRTSTDPTLFVWTGKPSPYSNALPSSPGCYDVPCYISSSASTRVPITCGNGLIGDPLRTLTKVGLRVKLLVAPVKCDCCNASPGVHHFRPVKQSLSCLGEIKKHATHEEINSLALGIVNYRPVDDSHGALDTGKNYFCMVLQRVEPDWPWSPAHIGSIVVREKETFLRCTEDLIEQLETVCILHQNP